MIEVYKFGGASVKDADGIRNLAKVVGLVKDKSLLVVVSAMGKTTNALENLTNKYAEQDPAAQLVLDEIKGYHHEIATSLFPNSSHPIFDEIANSFLEIEWMLDEPPADDYDFIYDQIVSVGELVSSRIVGHYLNAAGIRSKWVDARGFIHTDNTYREGKVNWEKTNASIRNKLSPLLEQEVIITQGFIGGTSENYTTTLGREGSDFSAAIFASCLGAEALTIWKDVPGVLNADPKRFNETRKYEELSYREALEMTFYGATVIHPKTIKPLQNSRIPLYVKPFMAPHESGTCILEKEITPTEPAIIVKDDQLLLSVYSKDLSFIREEQLHIIYGFFKQAHVRINTMQLSAASFSACFDYDKRRFEKLKQLLQNEFEIRYNTGLTLLTVRHFNPSLLKKLTDGKTVLIEQMSRHTAQLVLK